MSGHFDDNELQAREDFARSQGVQCWTCPHCANDRHHHSDAQGCEQQPHALIQIRPLDV